MLNLGVSIGLDAGRILPKGDFQNREYETDQG